MPSRILDDVADNTFDFRIKEQDIRAWLCSIMIDLEGFEAWSPHLKRSLENASN